MSERALLQISSLAEAELRAMHWERLKAYLASGAPELSEALGAEAGWLWRAMGASPFVALFEHFRSQPVRAIRTADDEPTPWEIPEAEWLDGMLALAKRSGISEENFLNGCGALRTTLKAGEFCVQIRGQSLLGYPSNSLHVSINLSFTCEASEVRARLEQEALEGAADWGSKAGEAEAESDKGWL